MKPANIKSGYTDNLARQRRARILFKLMILVAISLIILVGIIYFLFFSKVLEVKSITLNGLVQANSGELNTQIEERLNQKIFRFIPRRSNLILINQADLKGEILSKYPVLKSLEIKNDYPHGLIFNFTERIALGVWCFKENCFYFDNEGNAWGGAARSSGFLITVVEDQRNLEEQKIEKEYLEAIKIFLVGEEPPLKIKNIIIEDSFRDFKVMLGDYYLLFALDSDIKKQLEILDIFLNEKGIGFRPQYIDMRIDGRIYYK